MRRLIVLGALALAACSGNSPTNNSAVSDADAGGEVTAVNDTTAIDAATGEAANMAADVNYTVSNDMNDETDNRSSQRKADKSPSPHEPDEPGVVLNNSEG
jgi:hypothetical protein